MPVEIEGLDQLMNNLNLVGNVPASAAAKAVFHQAGLVVRRYARFYAPFDPDRKKGTHLRDAILVSDGPKQYPNVLVVVSYKMKGGAPHAHLLEFGTVKMSARPYMRPASATAKPEVEWIIHDGILELIKGAPR